MIKRIHPNGTPLPRKPRVYVLDCIPERLDISSAAEWGDLWSLDSAPCELFGGQYPQSIVDAMERSGYKADVDYFLVAGHMANIAMVVGELVDCYENVKLLVFNAALQRYVVHVVGGVSQIAPISAGG